MAESSGYPCVVNVLRIINPGCTGLFSASTLKNTPVCLIKYGCLSSCFPSASDIRLSPTGIRRISQGGTGVVTRGKEPFSGERSKHNLGILKELWNPGSIPSQRSRVIQKTRTKPHRLTHLEIFKFPDLRHWETVWRGWRCCLFPKRLWNLFGCWWHARIRDTCCLLYVSCSLFQELGRPSLNCTTQLQTGSSTAWKEEVGKRQCRVLSISELR